MHQEEFEESVTKLMEDDDDQFADILSARTGYGDKKEHEDEFHQEMKESGMRKAFK